MACPRICDPFSLVQAHEESRFRPRARSSGYSDRRKLIQDVQAPGLPGMAGQAQLNAALNALAQDPPDIQAAINALQAFINW